MKGILIFYMNYKPDLGQTREHSEELINIVREQNQNLIDKIQSETDYNVMFVATCGEACRVDKVDFDMPFPRYVAPYVDIVQNDKIYSVIRQLEEDK